MRLLTLLLMVIFLTWSTSSLLHGDEPNELNFVQGLRERGYHDYALIYLNQLELKKNLAADIKALLPLEKALTLMDSASSLKNPDAQNQQYDQAVAYLEEFVKKNPQHPRAASANSDRARIFIGKAKVITWQSEKPANVGVKQKFQQDARELINQARTVFTSAKNLYEAEWKKFPSSIPPDDQQQIKAREQAEGLYMRSQLDLADTIYQEAQTYNSKSKEKNGLLVKASLDYESIHTRYRSHISGLFARLMEGKCFEEQDDIRRALGIYQELLSHDAEDTRLIRMQDQAFYFKLICYNHESRRDYALVIGEAENWLTVNKGRARSETGLGIRWELTRAQEAIANDRSTTLEEKDRLLRQALANAGEIHRFPGPYQDVAFSLIQKLRVALNREAGDPTDFETAFGLANKMIEDIAGFKERIAQAQAKNQVKEVQDQTKVLAAHLAENERIWRLALQLVTQSTDVQQVNVARYRLAYVLYLQQKNYEAAVLGEFLAIHFRATQSTTALDAGYLAMAALAQARSQASVDQREEMIPLVVKRCQYIVDHWPETDRAQDARMTMGRLLRSAKKDLDAAGWYLQVPVDSEQYPEAQLEAGKSLWNYVLSTNTATEAVDAKLIDEKIQQAKKALETGLNLKQKGLSENTVAPEDVIYGKVNLAQILIRLGQDQAALDLLSKGPQAVTNAIKVPDESKRSSSKTDVLGRTFASYVWQLMLRANVGAKKLNEARQAREQLEKIAGAEDSAGLTAIYVELGRELQNELSQLNQAGNTKRVGEVKAAFEAFLKDLSDRTEGQSYGSLIWIAETYFSLGKGSLKEESEARRYYDQASKMYRQVLTRAQADAKFLEADKVPGVKLRLATCQQVAGNYPEAETLINEVLMQNPKALDAQLEAARMYQSWGAKDAAKYALAINGNKGTGFWGWGQVATRLQIIAQQGGEKKDEYLQQLFESRYNNSLSRKLFADSLSGENAKLEREKSEFELVAFTRVMPALVESDYWEKFDQLYQQLLKDQNKVISSLKKPNVVTAKAKTNPAVAAIQKAKPQQPAVAVKTDTVVSKPDNSMTYLVVGIVSLLGIGMVGFVAFTGGTARKKKSAMGAEVKFNDIAATQKTKQRPIFKSIDENPPVETGTPVVKRKKPPEPPST